MDVKDSKMIGPENATEESTKDDKRGNPLSEYDDPITEDKDISNVSKNISSEPEDVSKAGSSESKGVDDVEPKKLKTYAKDAEKVLDNAEIKECGDKQDPNDLNVKDEPNDKDRSNNGTSHKCTDPINFKNVTPMVKFNENQNISDSDFKAEDKDDSDTSNISTKSVFKTEIKIIIDPSGNMHEHKKGSSGAKDLTIGPDSTSVVQKTDMKEGNANNNDCNDNNATGGFDETNDTTENKTSQPSVGSRDKGEQTANKFVDHSISKTTDIQNEKHVAIPDNYIGTNISDENTTGKASSNGETNKDFKAMDSGKTNTTDTGANNGSSNEENTFDKNHNQNEDCESAVKNKGDSNELNEYAVKGTTNLTDDDKSGDNNDDDPDRDLDLDPDDPVAVAKRKYKDVVSDAERLLKGSCECGENADHGCTLHKKETTKADEGHGSQKTDDETYRPESNLLFYQNKMSSRPFPGSTIEEMLEWRGDYLKLERGHSYIQWLFPMKVGSGLNTYAQRLYDYEAEAIINDKDAHERVLQAYTMMLDFYGIKLVDEETGEVKRNKNWRKRFQFLNNSRHNFMRITRIITSIGHLGYVHYQIPLVKLFMYESIVSQVLEKVNEDTLFYWMDAVEDGDEKGKLYETYFDMMAAPEGYIKEDDVEEEEEEEDEEQVEEDINNDEGTIKKKNDEVNEAAKKQVEEKKKEKDDEEQKVEAEVGNHNEANKKTGEVNDDQNEANDEMGKQVEEKADTKEHETNADEKKSGDNEKGGDKADGKQETDKVDVNDETIMNKELKQDKVENTAKKEDKAVQEHDSRVTEQENKKENEDQNNGKNEKQNPMDKEKREVCVGKKDMTDEKIPDNGENEDGNKRDTDGGAVAVTNKDKEFIETRL